VAPASHPASPKSVALQQPSPVLASPLLHTSSQPGSDLANSPTSLPTVSPPALNLVIDLSHFDLQQVSDSGVSASPPLAPRQHTMVLRPRKAKTANISVTSALEPSSSPTHEPSTFQEAQRSLPWKQAMQEEIQALHDNGTWTLVTYHSSMNLVSSRWVYKIKRRADGSVERYKARLVALGFTQQEGIDYSETFSPVIKPTTVRLVLTIAISNGRSLHQLDVHNAFLNGILQEEVYMDQPPGFVHSDFPTHVCRLHKSLYGLKQAPRAWYKRLSDFLLSIGFQASKADTSLFILFYGGGLFYLLVYVEDILLTRSNSELLHKLINLLSSEFKLRDLGMVHYFLGIEVKPTFMGILLSQQKYATDIISRAGMSSCKPVDTPSSPSSALTTQSGAPYSDSTKYRQIVGALQYLTFTRPDICYAVNKVCQFMHAPTKDHWAAVKRILRYLQATKSYGLHVTQGSPLSFHGFTDVDWAGSVDDRKSTGGYLVYLGNTPISWKYGKQRTVARSSTEAEYKALADGTAEILWLRSLLSELQLSSPPMTTLWCDNLRATFLSVNLVFHARTKHVEVDYHFVRDRVAKKEIQVRFISSKDN